MLLTYKTAQCSPNGPSGSEDRSTVLVDVVAESSSGRVRLRSCEQPDRDQIM